MPSLIQKVGDCGFKTIADVKTYEFNEDNYFVGLAGVPNDGWISVSPFTVRLRQFDVLESFSPSYQFEEVTDVYISPPAMKIDDTFKFEYPIFIQVPMCHRGKQFGVEVVTEMWDKNTVGWT